MKTAFPKNYLQAALRCAADQDVRYYLNGVFIEASDYETRLAGCDGASFSLLRYSVENTESFEVIVPRDIVALALKIKTEVMPLTCENGSWALGGIPFIPVVGRYPDYRRVIPAQCSGEAGNFSFELLARFHQIAKDLKLRNSPILRQNGLKGTALTHFYGFDDFIGVCMPLVIFNEKHPDLGMPKWGSRRD